MIMRRGGLSCFLSSPLILPWCGGNYVYSSYSCVKSLRRRENRHGFPKPSAATAFASFELQIVMSWRRRRGKDDPLYLYCLSWVGAKWGILSFCSNNSRYCLPKVFTMWCDVSDRHRCLRLPVRTVDKPKPQSSFDLSLWPFCMCAHLCSGAHL